MPNSVHDHRLERIANDVNHPLTGLSDDIAVSRPTNPRYLQVKTRIEALSEPIDQMLGKAIRFELQLDSNLWPAAADPERFDSALLHLVRNARAAMPDGGALVIHGCNAHSEPSGAASHAPPREYVWISVTDTGGGIPEETLARAAEPHVSVHSNGRGFGSGLASVERFAHESGGFLRLESAPGGGATVSLYLPRALAA